MIGWPMHTLGRCGLVVPAMIVMMMVLATLPGGPVSRAQDEPTWTVLAGDHTAPGDFNGPGGLAVDAEGNLYVADSGNDRVQKLSPSGEPLAQWGSHGSGPGQFEHPQGVAVDGHGNVYVTDQHSRVSDYLHSFATSRIQKLSPMGEALVLWESRGQYFSPDGVAVDDQGNVYVAGDSYRHIQKLSPSGELLAQWGDFLPPGVDVAVDRDGNVYVAESQNHRIHKLSPSGEPLAQWGSKGSDPGQFYYPRGVAVDGQGNVYVADSFNDRIQELSPSGEPLAQWGSQGSNPGQFRHPTAVAVDHGGNVYVADTGNNRIQKLTVAGRARGR